MTPTDSSPRPRQTTVAGWLIVLGSALSVMTAFEVVGGVRSIETREAVERFLAEPPGSGLGLDIEAGVVALQVTASVAAVCAVMAGILGVFVLRRDRAARWGVSVLALPLFVTGLALGGFMTSLVAAAAVLLWLSPSREWFAGRPLPEGSLERLWPGPPSAARSATPEVSGPVQDPAPPSASPSTPAAASTPYGAPHEPDHRSVPAPATRPGAVSAAVALTLVSSTLVLLVAAIGVVTVALMPDLVMEELERQSPDLADQGLGQAAILTTSLVTGGMLVAATLLAIAFAIGVLARRTWAARGLLVMAVLTLVFCVLASIGSLVAVLPAIAAVIVIRCLRKPESRAWVASRGSVPPVHPPQG